MSLRSIKCLQKLFQTKDLMELLYRDDIRAKIADIKFFLQSQMYHLYACVSGVKFWFYKVCERGDWIKVHLDEDLFGEFQICEEDYLRLMGCKPKPKRKPKRKVTPEPETKGSSILGGAFLITIGGMIGYQVWLRYKS